MRQRRSQQGLQLDVKKIASTHFPFLESEEFDGIIERINELAIGDKIQAINHIKLKLHEISPFKTEPVDCVIWIPHTDITANDYNPNSVAPPEMELLRKSIHHDGYTQPVVTWPIENGREVVDGFHRTRVCKEFDDVNQRVHGYLPVVTIKEENTGRNDRIASTIRHNRARGKHNVESMSEIVVELKKRNWSSKKIGNELGMDPDEVLRLCQVSGLTELFANDEFSKSWDLDVLSDEDIELVFNEEDIEPDKDAKDGRILHTYEKWECHKAGFYGTTAPVGLSKEQCEEKYSELLSSTSTFGSVLEKVIVEWKNSCEHYLTNDTMNRIAWLGQAALCFEYGIPACFRNGYNLLTKDQQYKADRTALKYLNIWLRNNGFETVGKELITNKPKADIY